MGRSIRGPSYDRLKIYDFVLSTGEGFRQRKSIDKYFSDGERKDILIINDETVYREILRLKIPFEKLYAFIGEPTRPPQVGQVGAQVAPPPQVGARMKIFGEKFGSEYAFGENPVFEDLFSKPSQEFQRHVNKVGLQIRRADILKMIKEKHSFFDLQIIFRTKDDFWTNFCSSVLKVYDRVRRYWPFLALLLLLTPIFSSAFQIVVLVGGEKEDKMKLQIASLVISSFFVLLDIIFSKVLSFGAILLFFTWIVYHYRLSKRGNIVNGGSAVGRTDEHVPRGCCYDCCCMCCIRKCGKVCCGVCCEKGSTFDDDESEDEMVDVVYQDPQDANVLVILNRVPERVDVFEELDGQSTNVEVEIENGGEENDELVRAPELVPVY